MRDDWDIYIDMMLTLLIVGYLLGAIMFGYSLYRQFGSISYMLQFGGISTVLGTLFWPIVLFFNIALSFRKVSL